MSSSIFKTIFASLLILSGCQKNENQSTSVMADQSSQIKIVEKTVDRLNKALLNKDKTELEQICAEGLSYGHSTGVIQDKKAFIDDVVNGPLTFLSIQVEDQTIGFYDDLSIVRHIFVAKAINKGDTIDLRLGSAHLYKLDTTGNCKLVLRQGF